MEKEKKEQLRLIKEIQDLQTELGQLTLGESGAIRRIEIQNEVNNNLCYLKNRIINNPNN